MVYQVVVYGTPVYYYVSVACRNLVFLLPTIYAFYSAQDDDFLVQSSCNAMTCAGGTSDTDKSDSICDGMDGGGKKN